MKSLALTLPVAIFLVYLHTGCERHPASETIPQYAEKMKKEEAKDNEKASHSESADPQAPSYFPPKN